MILFKTSEEWVRKHSASPLVATQVSQSSVPSLIKSFIVLELHRLLALVRFAHLCWWKTDGTVTSVSRVANTSCWKFSLLILRFQFIALPPAMLTASLTVRGQSSVRGNFGWSKQNPINEWKYLFGPKPAFIQCKIILLAITSDVCCLSAEESLPVCLHPSPEDGASSTAAGVTSCEVTLQWRAGGESPVREWAMAVHLYVIRPQVLHSGSDVSDGVVRRSICMWNLHKQCVWKLERADR